MAKDKKPTSDKSRFVEDGEGLILERADGTRAVFKDGEWKPLDGPASTKEFDHRKGQKTD